MDNTTIWVLDYLKDSGCLSAFFLGMTLGAIGGAILFFNFYLKVTRQKNNEIKDLKGEFERKESGYKEDIKNLKDEIERKEAKYKKEIAHLQINASAREFKL